MSWNDIAIKHGTDKSTLGHGYMPFYEEIMQGREVHRVLEIGVDEGASVNTWAEIFPNADIVGIDILPRCAQYATDQIRIIINDASKPNVFNNLGSFDLIIDDGSHQLTEIRGSLQLLTSHLTRNGIYAIEDTIMQRSEWPATIDDVLYLLPQFDLQMKKIVHSKIPFVQGDVYKGDFALVLAGRP